MAVVEVHIPWRVISNDGSARERPETVSHIPRKVEIDWSDENGYVSGYGSMLCGKHLRFVAVGTDPAEQLSRPCKRCSIQEHLWNGRTLPIGTMTVIRTLHDATLEPYWWPIATSIRTVMVNPSDEDQAEDVPPAA